MASGKCGDRVEENREYDSGERVRMKGTYRAVLT